MRANPTEPFAGVTPRRFKPYPAYKDSGIEWLGQIPAHWRIRRLKYLASLNPESLAEDADPTLEIIYVDIGGVDSLGRIVEKQPLVFASAPSRARRLVRDGDVIVSTVRTYLRAIAAISTPESNLVVSTGFAVVRPGDDLTTGYAAHALRAPFFVELVVANSKGVSFPAINETEMATFGLAVPPPLEQSRVAAFLDRETARIDALVAEKKRLLDLLNEQRASLITQAVTKGLDPNMPMKDSGLDWLGSIPAHWTATRVRFLTDRIVDGVHHTPEYVEDGIPFITVKNLTSQVDGISFDEVDYITHEAHAQLSKRASPRKGDLLLTKDGTLGVPRIVDTDRPFSIFVSVALLQVRHDKVLSRFLRYVFESEATKEQFRSRSMGSALKHLHLEEIASIRVALPPLKEQDAIVRTLDDQLKRLSILVHRVGEAIERLGEYRTALISAAVTGKIDVREEVA